MFSARKFFAARRLTISQQPQDSEVVSGNAAFSVSASMSDGSAIAYQWQQIDLIGAAWTQRTLPAVADWSAAAFGNGVYVVVADGYYVPEDAGIAASSVLATQSGSVWTRRTLPAPRQWFDVVYGNGLFVAVAQGSSSASSSDGETWTLRSMPVNVDWESVAYGGNLFVSAGRASAIAASSPDGITWTQRAMPTSANWSSLAYGGGLFVAVASGSTIAASSPDGITWTQRTLPASVSWRRVAYGNGTFVAVATGSSVAATSTDGVTWTQRAMPVSATWNSVVYAGNTFVAVASGTVAATSPDGVNWTQRTMPVSATWRGLVYGGEQLIAVAEDSDKAATSVDVEDLFGKTTSTLSLISQTSANFGDRYRAILRPGGLEAVTSNSAMVFVSGTLRITQQPSSASTSSGGSASFSVAATNDNASAISYTWQDRYNENQFWANISPAETSATLSLTNVSGTQDGRQLRVVVTDANGQSVISSPAILSVRSLITIAEPYSSGYTLVVGTGSLNIQITATVDSSLPLSYTWEQWTGGPVDLSSNWSTTLVNAASPGGLPNRLVVYESETFVRRFRVIVSHPNADSKIPVAQLSQKPYTNVTMQDF